jgi:acyl-CoA synthetase (AMP-forming)/AMP-acid ligase II
VDRWEVHTPTVPCYPVVLLYMLPGGGRLLPGVNVRVLRPDGSLARNGERGELIVKGPSIALGYFDNPEAYDFVLDFPLSQPHFMTAQ